MFPGNCPPNMGAARNTTGVRRLRSRRPPRTDLLLSTCPGRDRPGGRVHTQGFSESPTAERLLPMFRNWFRKVALRRMNRAARRGPLQHRRLSLQPLEDRAVPAVIANPDPAAGHEAAYLVNAGQALHVLPTDGVLVNDVGSNLSVV